MKAPPNKPTAELSCREVRVATWSEFGPGGYQLPRRSSAKNWRQVRLLIVSSYFIGTMGLYVLTELLWPARFVNLELAMALAAIPAMLIYGWWKAKFNRDWVAHYGPDENSVSIKLEIDGFNYGHDIGKISFEPNWIYFEGEQTSFSLGPHDAARARASSWPNLGTVVLYLIAADQSIKIRLEGISITNVDLQNEFKRWIVSAQQAPGIAVLPPLEKSPRNDIVRTKGLLASVILGAVTFVTAILLIPKPNLFMGGRNLWHAVSVLTLVVLFTAFVVVVQRLFVMAKRQTAFSHLDQIRQQFGPSSATCSTVTPSVSAVEITISQKKQEDFVRAKAADGGGA